MEFFDTLVQVKSNWGPYKKWEHNQSKKEKQNEELRRKYPSTPEELTSAKQYGRTIVEAINTMDQHSIDKSEDAALIIKNSLFGLDLIGAGIGTAIGSMIIRAPKLMKKIKLPKFMVVLLGASLGESLTKMVGEIAGSQVEKQASRIARFQTRKNELSDSRNFVVYNDEQLSKAKQIAKTLPEVEEKRKDLSLGKSSNPIAALTKAKKTTDELSKDYKKYTNWKKDFSEEEELKEEKFNQINLSKSELSKAQKDRDNIIGIIKKIENYSLNYMMNMKLAIFSLQILLDGAGLGIGLGIFGTISQLQKHNVLKKESSTLNLIKTGSVKILPIAIGIASIGPAVKLIKDAARIGRFKAKQNLLNNPENFVQFDDEQRKTVPVDNTKKPKSKGIKGKFEKDIDALEQFKKDYAEYKNYMTKQRKEDLKLDEALKQIQISEKQKIDSENLQKKAFLAFEKMDEKAQRYTDDTDAGVDIVKMFILTGLSCAAKIACTTLFTKKAQAFNNGKSLAFEDLLSVLKYFKNKDILSIVGISLIPTLVSIPLAVKGIHIKKESGKIGIMQAMKDLNDPKNFLDADKTEQN